MKPSISIDLPGWCTLRNDIAESDNEPLLNPSEAEEDTATSTGGYTDFEASDHNISRGGSVCGDSEGEGEEGDEDEDTDGSIARLFSLDGLKRTRSTPESRSSTAGARPGQTPTTRPLKRGRPSSTASFDLQAEAFLDWACVRCTLINSYDQESCQGCGSANVKRNRLMRERRKELKQRGRLQAERECRNRSLKEEALKDVLEDSDADDERASSVASTTSAKEGSAPSEILPRTVESTGHKDSSWEHSASGKSPSGSMAKASVAAGSGSQVRIAHGEDGIRGGKHRCACFVSMLPPDLLLQCAEFLGDSRSLCRAREVSRGWLLALDDREAGLRLWRPMFYRLRASGTIHAATNARGQRRLVPKQYDLGTLPTTGPGACSAPPGDGSGVSTAGATQGRTGRPSGRQTDALPRRSSSCLVCGLIQREGYAGNDCEMCASSLVVVDHRESPAAPPRVAYTRVQLSGSCGTSASPTSLPPRLPKGEASRTFGSPPPPSVVTRERNSGVLPGNGEGAWSGKDRDEGTDMEVDVDWHFLVKRMAEEKRNAAGWGSLHQGWVWLQGALQGMLHRRLGNEQPCSAALCAERRAGTEGSSCVPSLGLGAASCSAGNEGQNELEPRIARVARKLASKKWVVLYDSLKTMFTLQAEGIARGVVFEVLAAGISVAALRAAGRETEARRTGEVAELDGLRRCVRAWEAYKDWGEEVDMYCELLNEQISGERYRTAGAGCGRGDQTPFVRDAALLSFRHSFALNVQVCALLREAIFKGMAAMGVEATGAQGRKIGHHDVRATGAAAGVVEGTGNGRACSVEVEDSLFTDLELMEDSRAIDFTVRSFSRPNVGGRSAGSSFAPGALGRSRGSKPTHYYDWFLSKLEGKEAGIIRGDIDALGKSVERQNLGQDDKNPRAEKGGADGSGSAQASFEELLDLVRDMVEELDVRDDGLSKDRPTQGAMRRLLVLPIKRWQAAASEASAEDPRNMMLMAGLSPSPGNDGFHRLREGAAGRRKGKPTASTFRKNAGKSWEHLSTFFG